ncbi:MAG: hypothetical protein HOP15_09755 [Planctomycetes bacterium]|nr:hypothetical protein [Planctomycetota bacterium]
MRDKGLVFEEMRRQRRAMVGPMVEEWFLWVVVVAVLFVVASFASRAARARGEPASFGRRLSSAEHDTDGLTPRSGHVTRGGR